MGTALAAVRKKVPGRSVTFWTNVDVACGQPLRQALYPAAGYHWWPKQPVLSRTTIHTGNPRIATAAKGSPLRRDEAAEREGGRKPLTFHHPDLLKALEANWWIPWRRGRSGVVSFCAGLRRAHAKLAAELKRQGYRIGDRKGWPNFLHQMGI